ncbi:MAG: hypothetical protein ISQ08_12680, partial [Planctomycetes bacterium]|nr:hypothetical protein [Planctomycetota bacterium]
MRSAFLLLACLGACQSTPTLTGAGAPGAAPGVAAGEQVASVALDPHSRSEPHRVRVVHMDLDLALDFDAERLSGAVTHRLERPDPSA